MQGEGRLTRGRSNNTGNDACVAQTRFRVVLRQAPEDDGLR